MAEVTSLLAPFSLSQESNSLVWIGDHNGVFFVSSTYCFLLESSSRVIHPLDHRVVFLRNIWKSYAPSKDIAFSFVIAFESGSISCDFSVTTIFDKHNEPLTNSTQSTLTQLHK